MIKYYMYNMYNVTWCGDKVFLSLNNINFFGLYQLDCKYREMLHSSFVLGKLATENELF